MYTPYGYNALFNPTTTSICCNSYALNTTYGNGLGYSFNTYFKAFNNINPYSSSSCCCNTY